MHDVLVEVSSSGGGGELSKQDKTILVKCLTYGTCILVVAKIAY